MQSPVHKQVIFDNRGGITELPSHAIGWCGEPTIYRKEGQGISQHYMFKPGHRHYVGQIVLIGDYTYVLKEFDGEWWKLEWPD